MSDIPSALDCAAGCDIARPAAGAAGIIFGGKSGRVAPVDVKVAKSVAAGGSYVGLITADNPIARYAHYFGKSPDELVVLRCDLGPRQRRQE